MPEEKDPEDRPEVITPMDVLLTALRSAGKPLGRDALNEALNKIEADDGPVLLFDLDWDGLLETEACTLAGPVWCSATYPQDCADPVAWRGLFGRAGFCVDGVPAERPAEAITLYRASGENHKARWSWTDSLEQATKLAAPESPELPSSKKVWTATVEPERLLAGVTDSYGLDYVVDTQGLEISAVA
ncbi:hypothetical protein [Propionibacterium sp.]|uniref:hypothetical protein n=1 Tax=Propionibacterium sp. TaxID=1977903 RepID=UPI0039E87F8F